MSPQSLVADCVSVGRLVLEQEHVVGEGSPWVCLTAKTELTDGVPHGEVVLDVGLLLGPVLAGALLKYWSS